MLLVQTRHMYERSNRYPNCPLGKKCAYYHPKGNVTPAASRETYPAQAGGDAKPKTKAESK